MVRDYEERDLSQVRQIWNRIVEDGNAFPGDTPLTESEMAEFLRAQTHVGVAEHDGKVVGVYILHPNNIGRAAHIANASYGVAETARGLGVGEALVRDSLSRLQRHGFTGLQFNAVVATNTAAIRLYEKLGFTRVGVIPKGYRAKDVGDTDIIIYYHSA